ncbi:MAG TPA: PAS domain S-box protein, partial [Pararhizobium sp.]|nr:PAS domain S-box protein [Pararhizobium sp.]
MPVGQYPFIDVAVHRPIRERFAKGEALVVFSTDLQAVIWADGAGAELFGYDSLYEFMDDGVSRQPAVLRQLQGASSRLRPDGGEQTATLRIAQGFRTRLVAVTLASLRLSDGTPAVLVAGGTPEDDASPADRAERIIAGLGGRQTHVAVLDESGAILAASPHLEELALAPDILGDLVSEVNGGRDRLVKRMISTGRGRIPAAIARLSDAPALYLVFAIETEAGEDGEKDGRPPSAAPAEAPELTAATGDDVPPAAKTETSAKAGTVDAEPAPDAPAETFHFDPAGKPARFVWKIDGKGRFSEISSDFARTVGPNAADIIGRRFEDVARVFGFDREGVISELLRRHDTWSGKSVLWPVQGTNLVVPVDLAALPTYTRERVFDGFRGFGIVRVGDAAEDLEAIGLSLVGSAQRATPSEGIAAEEAANEEGRAASTQSGESPEPVTEMPSAEMPEGPAVEDTVEAPAEESESGTSTAESDDRASGEHAPAPAQDEARNSPDPFRGETPALRIVPTEGRRESDKVIDLEQRRPRDLLSSGERAAFREIGRRLADAFGKRARQLADRPTEQPEEVKPGNEAAKKAEGAGAGETDSKAASAPQPAPDEAPQDTTALGGAAAPDRPTSDKGTVIPLPSAFAVGRAKQKSLDEEVIADLPVALLVHYGETLHYANAEFVALTGYEGIEALREAGGLGNLFASPDYAGETESRALPGTMRLIRADGSEVPVHARLQSIGWQDGRALMLSLRPAPEKQAAEPNTPVAPKAGPEADNRRSAALQVEVEELRSILETATDGVVILGEHGDIRSMNRSASALFDYDEAETRGQPFAKLFAHESQRAVMDYLNGLSEHGVASVLNDGREVIGREASGGFIPLFMTIGRLSGSNGFCAVMRDITQWKRTEEELRAAKYAAEQASSHKSEFLARVSHEIRTPLNAIIGFADMMAEQRFGPIGGPRYLEYAHDIGRSGKHVLDIVNDLLDISKIEAGEMEVAFAAVALNETIAEAVSLLQPQANSQRVIIRTSLSSSVP